MADGDLYLNNNANSSEALVEKSGKRYRSTLTSIVPGTLELSKRPNVDTGYVKDTNGYKHQVKLVATIPGGTLRLSDNPSVKIAYCKDSNGYEHKVNLIADVSNGGGGNLPISYREFDVDSNMLLIPSITTDRIINLNGAKDISDYALYCAYYGNGNISGDIDFTSLAQLSKFNSCYYTFYQCSNINTLKMNNITAISGQSACNGMMRESSVVAFQMPLLMKISGSQSCAHMFEGCQSLEHAGFPQLQFISGVSSCHRMLADSSIKTLSLPLLEQITASNACVEMCAGCPELITVFIPRLQAISVGGACKSIFTKCTMLGQVVFDSLKLIAVSKVFEEAFANDTNLTLLQFPSLTSSSFGTYQDQFHNMLMGCNNVVVQFPSNLQSIISTWADAQAGFGSSTTTILYNLPATT